MSAEERIEHSGRVVRVAGDKVTVAIESNSACAGCSARKACGVSESAEKIVEVRTAAAAEYAEGEEVVVSVRRAAGLRAVALAYAVPLAVLMAVLAGAKAAGADDGAAAGAAIGGVAVWYAVLWLFRRRMEGTVSFGIRKK